MKYKKKTYQENTISCEIIYSMVADESKMYKSWNKQDSLEWTEENFFRLFLLFIRKANGSEYEPDTLPISHLKIS